MEEVGFFSLGGLASIFFWKLRPRKDLGIHFLERKGRTANGDGEKKTKHP